MNLSHLTAGRTTLCSRWIGSALGWLILGASVPAAGQVPSQSTRPDLPNIVLILIDDMGFGESGMPAFSFPMSALGRLGEVKLSQPSRLLLTPRADSASDHSNSLIGVNALLFRHCAMPFHLNDSWRETDA